MVRLILFLGFITLSSSSCNELWGDHRLGNHLSLLEGDRIEDRIIVYCSNKGVCYTGITVIPTYERHYNSNRYAEYVKTAASNSNWVFVKTFEIKYNRENYWLISKNFDIENIDCTLVNCDSILQSHVLGPFSFLDFQEKLHILNIDFKFE